MNGKIKKLKSLSLMGDMINKQKIEKFEYYKWYDKKD